MCRNGVEVLVNTKVESIDADALTLVKQGAKEGESQTVAYGACVWATGVAMHPLTKHLQQAMPEGTQTHSRYGKACTAGVAKHAHNSVADGDLWRLEPSPTRLSETLYTEGQMVIMSCEISSASRPE